MIKLFTHTDFDGIGCAVLATFAFGDEVEIEYCNYDEIDEKVEEYFKINQDAECHITDISISEKLVKIIDDSGKKYKLLDHHATALDLNKYSWCTVKIEDEETNIKTSGTELYYKWLIQNGYLKRNHMLNKFVEVVRDYDTWRWASLGEQGVICKQINDLMYLYGRDEFISWCILQIYNCVFPKLYDSDKLVLNIKQKEIDDYVEAKNKEIFIIEIYDKSCGIVFAERYSSELGNRLCELNPNLDFVAIINMKGTVSYRTIKDDINLGNIAKRFGGGGHHKAAGSMFSDKIKLKVIEEIFC